MTTATARASGFVLRGWHVLVAFLVFFGVDIAVNAVFMVSAYRTFPGETSVTPYEDGLAYNTALAEKRAQATLGWRLAADAQARGALRVEAHDRTGAPLRGLQVMAHLRRPATDTGQRSVKLSEASPGLYLAQTAPLAGAWDLEVTARDARAATARVDRRLTLP